MSTATPPQLPLALAHEPDLSRDSFMVGPSNRNALAMIDAWPDWPAPLVVLSGPEGSGKTHLACIWAQRSGAELLPAGRLEAVSEVLASARRGLVVEDVDPRRVPETALFHLINSARENGTGLLLTSRERSDEWRVGLADLRSRLRMAAPATLLQPDENLLRRALVKLFADRQLLIDKPVIDYLLNRMERSLAAAVRLVAIIDEEALASGRRITRRLVASLLSTDARASGEFTDLQ